MYMEYGPEVRDAGRVYIMVIEAVCTASSRGFSGARGQMFPPTPNIAEVVWSGCKCHTEHGEITRNSAAGST